MSDDLKSNGDGLLETDGALSELRALADRLHDGTAQGRLRNEIERALLRASDRSSSD